MLLLDIDCWDDNQTFLEDSETLTFVVLEIGNLEFYR